MPHGIRVNVLSPGTTRTGMATANTPEQMEEIAAIQLMPRMADPDEMVEPALVLASDTGSFITRHVVFVDRGMMPRREASLPL